MPRIKSWFTVSHDINADPEVWAMRHEIGEKALSVWLEFLSIADRNEGELPGDLEELIRLVAGRCQASQRTVRGVYEFALTRLWLNSETTLKVTKWAKYHRTTEQKPAPSEPSEPDRTKPNHKDRIKIGYPADFAADQTTKDLAVKNGWPDPDTELDAFRDFHIARGSRFKDWRAAFRTWLRNAKRFSRNGKATAADDEHRARMIAMANRGL